MVIYFNNMTTIGYITNKVLNIDNNVFSLNYDKRDPIKPIMQLVFMSLVNNRYNSKFIMLKETLISFLKFSRSEFIIVDGEPFMLEMNTIPGLTTESLIPQQAHAAGIALEDLFTNSIELALKK